MTNNLYYFFCFEPRNHSDRVLHGEIHRDSLCHRVSVVQHHEHAV